MWLTQLTGWNQPVRMRTARRLSTAEQQVVTQQGCLDADVFDSKETTIWNSSE